MGAARLGTEWGRMRARAAAGGASPLGGTAAQQEDRLAALTKFIPTETITMFVAVIAGMDAIAKLKGSPVVSPWVIYAAFALLTPLIVYALARKAWTAELDAQGVQPAPPRFQPPAFRMLAASAAYLVWALAIPGMVGDPVGQILAGIGAVVVPTLLSIFEPK